MDATETGFEMSYTKPLSQETADALAESYSVTQWRYVPTPEYGGPKVGEEVLPVTSADLSDDRKKVTLEILGLKPGYVVHVRSPRPFTAEGGQELWSTEAWYTLNNIPGDEDRVPTAYEAEEARLEGGANLADDHAYHLAAASSPTTATRAPPPRSTSRPGREAPTTSDCATPTARTPSPAPRRSACTSTARR